MAKVKFSALVSDMRNKLNGSVFSKNRGGSYLRNKVTPVNPQTTYQSTVRGWFQEGSQAWRGLTEEKRTAWNNAVDNFKKTDIFGDIKTPSGSNLFLKLWMNANNAKVSPLSSPPIDNNAPVVMQFTASCEVGAGELPIEYEPALLDNANAIIEATPCYSTGKSFNKNLFSVITTLTSGSSSPYDLYADYIAKYGAPIVGQKLGIRIKLIDTGNMVAGPYYTDVIIVQA